MYYFYSLRIFRRPQSKIAVFHTDAATINIQFDLEDYLLNIYLQQVQTIRIVVPPDESSNKKLIKLFCAALFFTERSGQSNRNEAENIV